MGRLGICMAERLTIEGLRYAAAVSEMRSFSAAARSLGVTQPALSNGIAKLEEKLGGQLFERSFRGVTPTPFGIQILPRIILALKEIDAITAAASRLTSKETHHLRLGVSPLINPNLVTRFYTALSTLEPRRSVAVREADLAVLSTALAAEELDVILIPSVGPLPGYERRIIDADPVVLVGAGVSRGNLATVEFQSLGDQEMLMVPDTCGLGTFTTQLFADHNLPLNRAPGQASSYRVLEQWAQMGLGSALLPMSKLTTTDEDYQPLMDGGHPVEIFFEAVWHPLSQFASDLADLTSKLAVENQDRS